MIKLNGINSGVHPNSTEDCSSPTDISAIKRAKKNARNAAYYAAHREKLKARHASYRASHPEKVKACNAAWYKSCPEKTKANYTAWVAANPEKMRSIRANNRHRRRARERNCQHSASPKDVRVMFAKARRCLYCDAPFTKALPKTLDHIMPLARGGAHSVDNFAVCCRPCNSRKKAMTPDDWAAKIGMMII